MDKDTADNPGIIKLTPELMEDIGSKIDAKIAELTEKRDAGVSDCDHQELTRMRWAYMYVKEMWGEDDG